MPDKPLKLCPHLAPRVWGGGSLGHGIGEAWDLSVHPNGPSTIAEGPWAGRTLAELAADAPEAFGGPIRLLAKRLDCVQDLSVQVHPREGDPKTEAWVVLAARPCAGVYHGFRAPVSVAQVRAAALDGTLPGLLRFLPLQTGDCVFVPSGTVHAIGAGLRLFELQQSADTTYRLFDWGRDRPLHLEQALACGDPGPVDARPVVCPLPDGAERLVTCEHFSVDRVRTSRPYPVDPGNTWRALLLTAGAARMGGLGLRAGETLLLPAAAGAHHLDPQGACEALLYGPTRSSA